ncbi:hypothetical protein BDV06DRAFT_155558 [Aspergillus oleicola]
MHFSGSFCYRISTVLSHSVSRIFAVSKVFYKHITCETISGLVLSFVSCMAAFWTSIFDGSARGLDFLLIFLDRLLFLMGLLACIIELVV